MLPKKMDTETVNQLKMIFRKYDINNNRILIDLVKETVEVEDNYSVDDLLETAGTLTPERAKELTEDIRKSREEWD
jgi:hypothetical protein